MFAESHENLERALATLGELLTYRGQHCEIAIVGGSGLMLLGLLRRPTADVDVVAVVENGRLVSPNPLPEPLRQAVSAVAADLDLATTWLNAGPNSLLDFGLPVGFLSRCEVLSYGDLTIHVASRLDQVHFKVYAAADQGRASKHFDDLVRLEPSSDELIAAARWCRTHDPSEAFRYELVGVLAEFGVEDVDGKI